MKKQRISIGDLELANSKKLVGGDFISDWVDMGCPNDFKAAGPNGRNSMQALGRDLAQA